MYGVYLKQQSKGRESEVGDVIMFRNDTRAKTIRSIDFLPCIKGT